MAFALSILLMLGMAVWFPQGVAGINHIIMPLILFPLIWAVSFFYSYLNTSTKQVGIVFAVLAVSHLSLLVWHFQR